MQYLRYFLTISHALNYATVFISFLPSLNVRLIVFECCALYGLACVPCPNPQCLECDLIWKYDLLEVIKLK